MKYFNNKASTTYYNFIISKPFQFKLISSDAFQMERHSPLVDIERRKGHKDQGSSGKFSNQERSQNVLGCGDKKLGYKF